MKNFWSGCFRESHSSASLWRRLRLGTPRFQYLRHRKLPFSGLSRSVPSRESINLDSPGLEILISPNGRAAGNRTQSTPTPWARTTGILQPVAYRTNIELSKYYLSVLRRVVKMPRWRQPLGASLPRPTVCGGKLPGILQPAG